MPVSPYRPNWSAYFTICDSEAAVISLDLGLAAVAPDPDRPTVLILSLTFVHPLSNGFPDDEELERLHLIENRLAQEIHDLFNGRFAGKVTIAGKRHLFFYLASGRPFETVVASAMAGFEEYEAEFHAPHDPDWQHYFSILYPGQDDLPIESTDPSLRTADHWFYFNTEEGCRQFIERLNQTSLAPVHLEKLKDGKAYPFLLIITGVHTTAQGPALSRLEARLKEWAEACGGIYDGWEAE